MQRVRIGLTGLAFVFILVMLAAIFTQARDEEAPITPNSLEQQTAPGTPINVAASKESEPKEPLAELGVAPGNAKPAVNESAPAGAAE